MAAHLELPPPHPCRARPRIALKPLRALAFRWCASYSSMPKRQFICPARHWQVKMAPSRLRGHRRSHQRHIGGRRHRLPFPACHHREAIVPHWSDSPHPRKRAKANLLRAILFLPCRVICRECSSAPPIAIPAKGLGAWIGGNFAALAICIGRCHARHAVLWRQGVTASHAGKSCPFCGLP